eukprot:CAMPEP_0206530230 /NCGR_PEP_ID=MMETSP0325_2-20121206/3043_1 /ASSEMBLY_ACC=CAM_ASM_000347 /TAXON_ID=2866 /ORGANISM="Crypthecodinium cohnii, Strain Seligo" /LENGTH=359 /DNA_ID=CAMNT_0054026237 /DNA_START=741 /DNA_END=1820 /DNA_ORIENTATION=+
MAIIVWFLAVGAAIYRLAGDAAQYHDSDFASSYALFAGMLGVGEDADLSFYDSRSLLLVRVLFLAGLWVSTIPILNLMIAAMVSTYSRAEQNTLALSEKSRASAVLEAEDEMSFKERLKHFEAEGFDEPLLFSQLDKGPPGGVSVDLTSKQLTRHPSFNRRMDTVQFFSGEVGAEHRWPTHQPPRLGKRQSSSSTSSSHQTGSKGVHDDETLRREISELRAALLGRVAGGGAVGLQSAGGMTPSPSVGGFRSEATDCGFSQVPPLASLGRPTFALSFEAFSAMAAAVPSQHCLMLIEGTIYDVGGFLDTHPGGKGVLRAAAGKDATEDFLQAHRKLGGARFTLQGLPTVGVVVDPVVEG